MKKLIFLMMVVSSVFAVELKFYCGSTMSYTMQKIANKFEKQTGIKVNIIKGGSRKLLKTIIKKQDGDIYFPGTYKFLTQNPDLFSHIKHLGYNKAVIIVKKSNPKNIVNLNDFIRNDVRVVLGIYNKGSVGKISKQILISYKGKIFFDKVYKKAIKEPTSLEIVNDIKNNKADVSIDWKAVIFMDDNKKYLDYIPILYVAPKQDLRIAVVNFSKHKKEAIQFVNFARKNMKFFQSQGF